MLLSLGFKNRKFNSIWTLHGFLSNFFLGTFPLYWMHNFFCWVIWQQWVIFLFFYPNVINQMFLLSRFTVKKLDCVADANDCVNCQPFALTVKCFKSCMTFIMQVQSVFLMLVSLLLFSVSFHYRGQEDHTRWVEMGPETTNQEEYIVQLQIFKQRYLA